MSKVRICIDAGHYGKYNRSPANVNYYESEAMWKLHLLLKKYLEEYGVTVFTTRKEQAKDLGLAIRGQSARGCDLFISLHSNAVGSYVNESVDYVAVYHLVNDTTTRCDDESKIIASKLAPVVASVMGTKQGCKLVTRKINSDRNGDGIMNDNYYGVLHGARLVEVPGIILEHSFHTNTAITNWLLNDANLDKLAKAEAETIANHFGLKKTESSDFKPYKVKVICKSLNIRKTPKWDNADVVGTINNGGVYTIVGETYLGETKFGKLKSGAGWISLGSSYVKKL